ncbi:lysylphosphatidylglycerol synthase transmembrane domain-containing protein [Streptomonospora sp. DSM 45055]|uniref:Lysylphosphatidylglycerol synthase transmembrane domain-containing protein n=2 Tax=Streptomonospora wellingtoniae TaxID=3075544 RepID=A0ABU2KWY2_9ACTN|nr:lysylphosphatidylglycerol synthase transmembrane domain-containing protein [Streptomonospora sp. DSM 45055]MDT0303814.1 lysylphosphatidylglycerol synthase transmembrane domain-containing protein [Streptomonospora sp. DSM 45055]
MKSAGVDPEQGGDERLPSLGPIARRPVDLLAAAVGMLVIAAVLAVVRIATDGQEAAYPAELRTLLPPSVLALAAGLANLTVIVLAAVTALERLLRTEFRQIVRALSAACFCYGLVGAANAAVHALTPASGLPEVLQTPEAHGLFTSPLHAYIAAAVAYVCALPLGHLPRVRAAMWGGIALTSVSVLLAGVTTALSLLLTVLAGWTCASVAAYAVGLSKPVPATGRLLRELRRFGWEPLGLTPLGGDAEGNQRYAVDTVDRRLDVVLFRAEDTRGLWKRLLGAVMLRGPAAPSVLLGVQRRVEHAALMDFAARAAGAAGPRVLGVGELGLGSVALVTEHVPLRPLDELDADELTDEVLDEVYAELALLHRNRITHGNLNGSTVGRRLDGRVVFTGLANGTVAGSPIKASLDAAALMTLLALRVGERRAVDSAMRVLGRETAAAALPFLQTAGMPFALRGRLRAHRGTLGAIRAQITGAVPEAKARPARLERMHPRTVVSVAVATAVGIVLAYQLAGVDFGTIAGADLGWAAAAFGASTLCMVAAAMALMGFVPIRLNLWTTVLVQFAGSFVRIAAPAGLGSLAINTRYVSRMGASAGLALSAVGLSQAVGLILHVPLLLVAAYLTGTSYLADFSPSATVMAVTAGLALAVALVLLVPGLRRSVLERARPYFQHTLPQLLDLMQHPRRLVMGVGGTLLLTAGFVMCLGFSVAAFGGSVGIAALVVVFLAGNAIGSAAPTPGGLGAVEAALLGGLTTVAGVPAAVGLPAVLLYRLLTFWLPVLPGWGAFHLLQRWKAI